MAKLPLLVVFAVLSAVSRVMAVPAAPVADLAVNLREIIGFDDLTSRPLGLPALLNPPPTPYRFLAFPSFNVINLTQTVQLGPRAHSPDNAIGSGVVASTTMGPAMITAQYAGSRIARFDLFSVYILGAVNTVGAAVETPQSITLQFTGKTTTGKTVVTTGSYNAGNIVPAPPMQKVPFPSSFRNLTSVTVAVQAAASVPQAAEFFLDDVEVQVYSFT